MRMKTWTTWKVVHVFIRRQDSSGRALHQARQTITDIFELNHRCYGYRRLQASLTRQCVTISEKVVQRLMKQESLVVAKPKRRRYGSYLGEISPAPENLINRDFHAAAPNEKWLTDITEFQIPAGKVYRFNSHRAGCKIASKAPVSEQNMMNPVWSD
jgi:transposase InsO family protein